MLLTEDHLIFIVDWKFALAPNFLSALKIFYWNLPNLKYSYEKNNALNAQNEALFQASQGYVWKEAALLFMMHIL